MRPRALLHVLHHRVNIILTDFNLAVLTPTAKLPNLIPRQSCTVYEYVCMYMHKHSSCLEMQFKTFGLHKLLYNYHSQCYGSVGSHCFISAMAECDCEESEKERVSRRAKKQTKAQDAVITL